MQLQFSWRLIKPQTRERRTGEKKYLHFTDNVRFTVLLLNHSTTLLLRLPNESFFLSIQLISEPTKRMTMALESRRFPGS